MLLVLNKCDQPTKELPFNEYRQRFPALTEYLKVSCVETKAYTIETLQQAIYNVLCDNRLLSHIGAPLPKVWVIVMKKLSSCGLRKAQSHQS